MLAEKVLAGKSKIEDYFPEYAHYTVPEDGKVFHHAGTGPAGIAQPVVPLSVSLYLSHTHAQVHKHTPFLNANCWSGKDCAGST